MLLFWAEEGDGMFLESRGIYLRAYRRHVLEEHRHLHRRKNFESHTEPK
jgi:hypothetical protein